MTPAPLADLAERALKLQLEVHYHLGNEPACSTDDNEWVTWAAKRDLLVTEREFAAQRFLEHPEYAAWHRQTWRDDLTLRVRAMSVWAPVARRVVAGGAAAHRVDG